MKENAHTNAGTQSDKLNNTSAASQRERLLKALLQGPISTVQARHDLNILAPAPRVYELRHDHGKNIVTHWIDAFTPEGHKHRVAEYVLLAGKWRGVLNG